MMRPVQTKNNYCESVIPASLDYLLSDVLRVVLDKYPAVFLTDGGEVLDVSEKFRSCCADNADRTFLSNILDEKSFEDFTKDFLSGKCSTRALKVYYLRYRYGFAVRLPVENGCYAVLILTESAKSLLFFQRIFSDDISESEREALFSWVERDNGSISSSIGILMDPYDEIDELEGLGLINALAKRLSAHSELYPYKIKIEQGEFEVSHKVRIHSGGCSLLLMTVLNILGPLSKNASILLKCTCTGDDFRVSASVKPPCDLKLRGKTDRILTVASHFPGSFMHLAIGELASLETGMYVSLSCEEDRVCFDFGSRKTAEYVISFNYRDPEEMVDGVFALVLDVLLEISSLTEK